MFSALPWHLSQTIIIWSHFLRYAPPPPPQREKSFMATVLLALEITASLPTFGQKAHHTLLIKTHRKISDKLKTLNYLKKRKKKLRLCFKIVFTYCENDVSITALKPK